MANDVFRLLRVFRETLDDDELVFEADSMDPIEGWDSLAHVQLMLAIEEEFGLSLTTEEIADMTSVPAILGVLREKGAAA